MNKERYFDIVSGRAGDFSAGLWRLLFWALAVLYKSIVRARLLLYRAGILRSHKVDIPVICVGNLSVGGTGKTPFVALVCRHILGMKLAPVIVSRGYRSSPDGKNDEARLLAELVPGVPHIQNPNRVAAAREAKRLGADVVVLDDGFSHLKLKRDLDILLIDGMCPFGYEAMLPLGLLREPARSAKRAHLAVITRSDLAIPEELHRAERRLKRYGFDGKRLLHARHMASALTRIDQDGQEALPLSALDGVAVALMSGIGNASGFTGTVATAGAKIVEETHLMDHFGYDNEWLKHHWPAIAESAVRNGAQYLVVTQKDGVKLRHRLKTSPLPVLELAVEMELVEGTAVLDKRLKSVLVPEKQA